MSQDDPNSYKPYYYSAPGQNHRSATPINQTQEPLKHHKKKGKKFFLLILIVVVAGSVYLALDKHDNPKQTVHSIATAIKNKPTTKNPTSNSAAVANMGQTIDSIINADTGIQISVNLINLNNNQAEHYGVNQTFQAASTAKILTAADFLTEVEKGQHSLTEKIGGQTAQYELQQMIVVSDDTAWANLNTTLGYNQLKSYADKTLGISDYEAYNNSLSSKDIALALQKLWNGSLIDSSDRALLLSYLKQANYREYIVPAVPSQDTIYHKIGLYDDYVNDAAIITHGKQAFVIVIFTNGNGAYNWPARATMMQQVTKAALAAYFKQ
jgi:beta-lactamase class A